MEQFTASEVRDWERAYKGTGAAKVFGAYADLLEAREKAVPVAYALFTEKGLLRMWAREWFADVHGAPVNPTPLYTHHAPSDDAAIKKREQEAKDAEVYSEIDRATAKFPTWPTDPLHAVSVLGEEYGELVKATLQHTYEPHKSDLSDVREEAVQTAAMAIRFVRSLDRYEYARCPQHVQANNQGNRRA